MKTNDLDHRIARAGQSVEARWDDARQDAALDGLQQKRRRRTAARAATVACAAVAFVAAGVALYTHDRAPSAPIAAPIASPNVSMDKTGIGEVRFNDGSLATLLSEGSRIQADEDKGNQITNVKLSAGRARFDVVPDKARRFRVEAGNVTVVVLGTKFTVDRSGARVTVAVERGRVRIERDGTATELGTGETGIFPEQAPAPSAPAGAAIEPRPAIPEPAPAQKKVAMAEPPAFNGTPARPAPEGPVTPEVPLHAEPVKTWKTLAQEGSFEQAYALLAKEPAGALPSDPADLLLMADVARLAKNPQGAIAPLERIVRGHPSDPRAPLAAFTLGRVLLDELGNPRAAAGAFHRTQALDAAGPLAQDALAREVEAWSRAGEPALARERAEEYLKVHADGRRVGLVKKYGGLQ